MENPDLAAGWILTECACVLRDADGSIDVVHETHRTGVVLTHHRSLF